jgi:hypothetical protein
MVLEIGDINWVLDLIAGLEYRLNEMEYKIKAIEKQSNTHEANFEHVTGILESNSDMIDGLQEYTINKFSQVPVLKTKVNYIKQIVMDENPPSSSPPVPPY